MKIITNPHFYLELSQEEIKICTPLACSVYPIWLGKNRAVMRDAIEYYEKHPPNDIVECLHIVGHFGLSGLGSREAPVKELFKEDKKSLDNDRIFW